MKLEGTIEFVFVKYVVFFVDWDGTLIETQEVIHGADASLPADPKREGYTFSGWSISHTGITQDTTLTALYTQNSGTDTDNSDSGTDTDSSDSGSGTDSSESGSDTGGSKLAETGDCGIGVLGAGIFVFLSGSALIAGARRRKIQLL